MNKYQYMSLSAKALNLLNGFPLKQIYGGLGHILMFHRVTPKSDKPRLFANSYLEVTPEFLDQTIQYFKSHGYAFISIDEVLSHISQKNNNPFVIFTFDDGFKDNLEFAYPIFKKHNIPFTIYITTDFPDYKAILWWNHLENLVMTFDKLEIKLNNKIHSFTTASMEEKTFAFKALSRLIKQEDSTSFKDRLIQIFNPFDIDPFSGIEKLSLSWDEIHRLHKSSLVTVGAHTISHPVLNTLSEVNALEEIKNSKVKLENFLDTKISHFAYPFGGPSEIDDREVSLCERAGFSTAVTTFSANIFKSHIYTPLALPRIAVGMSMNKNTFDLIRYGVIPCLRNKGQRIVTV